MHIGILSDPHNFHTQKWAAALQNAGAKVTVFAFEKEGPGTPPYVRIVPRYGKRGKPTYLSYLAGGKDLAQALKTHKVDVLNPLNVTPFGVWGKRSGFHPIVQSALGADILEYPPSINQAPHLQDRAWSHIEKSPDWAKKIRYRLGRQFFRHQVKHALNDADLITGDNQHLLDKMNEWFGVLPNKMKVLIYGVEPELFIENSGKTDRLKEKLGIGHNQRVVLSPRGAKAIYQADIILEGFEKVLRKGVCTHKFIMLAAGYEVSTRIEAQARSIEAEFPQFKFVAGRIPREEVYCLWNLVDLFVSAPVYDGYSAAVAEGRYAGAMPVVNPIPANLEVIDHQTNGWVSQPFTAQQLGEDLIEILSDISGWKLRVSQINRDWIEEHSLVRKNAVMFVNWAKKLQKR